VYTRLQHTRVEQEFSAERTQGPGTSTKVRVYSSSLPSLTRAIECTLAAQRALGELPLEADVEARVAAIRAEVEAAVQGIRLERVEVKGVAA
jgi:hypothetical protein